MYYLKQLDVGYNYSPDSGKLFPTRGKGKGLMPTFEEVLSAFPERPFAINVKTEDESTAQLVEKALSKFPNINRANVVYIGSANELYKRTVPGIKLIATKRQHLECMEAVSNGALVKDFCENLLLALPFGYIKNRLRELPRLISTLHAVGAKIWVWDVNSAEDADLLKGMPIDAVGTYRIDKTISALKKSPVTY